MTRPARLLALSAVTVLALSGCFSGEPQVAEADQVPADQAEALAAVEAASEGGSEGAGGGGGGPEVTFVAVDIAYEDAPAEVPAGGATFVLDNQGAIIHNIVVEEAGDALVAEAEGGQTDSGEIALEPGSYTYYCSIAGHRAAGMEGTFDAVEGAGGGASEPAGSEPAEGSEPAGATESPAA